MFVCDDGGARLLFLAQARATVATREDALASHHAPEQVLGSAIDNRTDIWALGALMARLATGRASSAHGLGPHLSPEVAAVVKRAMEHNPASRFRSAQEMFEALPEPRPTSSRGGAGGALPPLAPAATPSPVAPQPVSAERRAYAPFPEQRSSDQRSSADDFIIHPPLPPTMTSPRRESASHMSSGRAPPPPKQLPSAGQQSSVPFASWSTPPAAPSGAQARGSLGLAITREDPPHRVPPPPPLFP